MSEYQGQYKQDKYLDKLFGHKKNGFFVDIGAHDGLTFSNSYFFEKNRDWNGVCVEPIPEIFSKLDKTRGCIKINGCISETEGKEKFLRVKGTYVDTEMLSGLVKDYNEEHLNRIGREINELGGSKEEIDVVCYRINDILKQNNVNKVDFFTIDTEGNELNILKSIDFDQIDIDIILAENNYNDKNMRDFMESKGFKMIKCIGHDDVYRNKKYLTFFQKYF